RLRQSSSSRIACCSQTIPTASLNSPAPISPLSPPLKLNNLYQFPQRAVTCCSRVASICVSWWLAAEQICVAEIASAPRKSAPSRFAPLNCAPLRMAPCRTAPRKSAPRKSAASRNVPLNCALSSFVPASFAEPRYAPRKSAWFISALSRSASRRSAFSKLARDSCALVRWASYIFAPSSLALTRTAPAMELYVRSAPAKSADRERLNRNSPAADSRRENPFVRGMLPASRHSASAHSRRKRRILAYSGDLHTAAALLSPASNLRLFPTILRGPTKLRRSLYREMGHSAPARKCRQSSGENC